MGFCKSWPAVVADMQVVVCFRYLLATKPLCRRSCKAQLQRLLELTQLLTMLVCVTGIAKLSCRDCLNFAACQTASASQCLCVTMLLCHNALYNKACVSQELQRSVADGKPGELVTWTPEPETGTIPRYVADGLDAVVTLGGDGTVLWTCSILGNGSVPPLVPFAMGSLGFMTPFAMEKMTKTLEQVCTPCLQSVGFE